MGAWPTQGNTLLFHTCYRTKFRRSTVADRLDVQRVPKHFADGGVSPDERGMADHSKHASLPFVLPLFIYYTVEPISHVKSFTK